MASITNPAGIKDDKRKFLTMVLILSENSTTPPCKIIKCESDPLLRAKMRGPDSAVIDTDWA